MISVCLCARSRVWVSASRGRWKGRVRVCACVSLRHSADHEAGGEGCAGAPGAAVEQRLALGDRVSQGAPRLLEISAHLEKICFISLTAATHRRSRTCRVTLRCTLIRRLPLRPPTAPHPPPPRPRPPPPLRRPRCRTHRRPPSPPLISPHRTPPRRARSRLPPLPRAPPPRPPRG